MGDFLASAQNEEFILFRDDDGKHWAFPRAHMVSAKTQEKLLCEFNFHTHLVVFNAKDCVRILAGLMDGGVSVVAAPPIVVEAEHIRNVIKLNVTPTKERE